MPGVVREIVRINEKIREEFGSGAYGWAPREAADLLAKSRLDRQVALSRCLRMWLRNPRPEDLEGRLILAWVNLGCLVEGSMKFFLSVYMNTYSKNPVQRRQKGKMKGLDPDELELGELREFFAREKVWMDADHRKWDDWILYVQQHRNAIHAYRNRDIGTFQEFHRAVKCYLELLDELESRVPFPDMPGSPD